MEVYDIFRRDICDQCLDKVCFQKIVCADRKVLGNHTCDSNVTWEGGDAARGVAKGVGLRPSISKFAIFLGSFAMLNIGITRFIP